MLGGFIISSLNYKTFRGYFLRTLHSHTLTLSCNVGTQQRFQHHEQTWVQSTWVLLILGWKHFRLHYAKINIYKSSWHPVKMQTHTFTTAPQCVTFSSWYQGAGANLYRNRNVAEDGYEHAEHQEPRHLPTITDRCRKSKPFGFLEQMVEEQGSA